MENELYVKTRELVVPGDFLAKGDFLLGEGAFRRGDKIYASLLGLVDTKEKFIKIIPLSGKYIPNPRDLVIGIISDVAFSNWFVDLNSPYEGVLSISNATDRFVNLNEEDLSKIYGIGDVVLAKVASVSQSMSVNLTMKDRGLFKLREGRLITISPTKVPRVIGKKGTMIQLLKDYTGCRITVGQNGRVWINGTDTKNVNITIETIRLIEKEAHTTGLTDKIKNFLESRLPAPKIKKVEEMIVEAEQKKEETGPELATSEQK